MRTIRTSVVILLLAAAGCGEPPGTKPGTNKPGGGAESGAKSAPGSPAERDATTFYGVDAVDAQNAFAYGVSDTGASGSVVMKTSDGGAHWTCVLRTALTDLVGVDFVDARNGAALTDGGTVYSTSDGGATWKASTDEGQFARRFDADQPSASYATVDGIAFSGTSNGWAFGSREEAPPNAKPNSKSTVTRPFVVRTTDGGATWTETKLGAGVPGVELGRGVFADAQNGWVIGGDVDDETPGALLRTTDGGATWKDVAPNAKQVAEDLSFADATHGWTIVASEDDTGTLGPSAVYATTDGGATWKQLSKVPAAMHAVRFADARAGWVVGENGKIYATTDGGTTWAEQTAQDWSGGQSIDVTDATNAGTERPSFTRFVLLEPGHGFASADLGVYEYRAK